jgi:hypothetical protein
MRPRAPASWGLTGRTGTSRWHLTSRRRAVVRAGSFAEPRRGPAAAVRSEQSRARRVAASMVANRQVRRRRLVVRVSPRPSACAPIEECSDGQSVASGIPAETPLHCQRSVRRKRQRQQARRASYRSARFIQACPTRSLSRRQPVGPRWPEWPRWPVRALMSEPAALSAASTTQATSTAQ